MTRFWPNRLIENPKGKIKDIDTGKRYSIVPSTSIHKANGFDELINKLSLIQHLRKSSFSHINISNENIKELTKSLKDKRFNDMRKWVVQNLDKEPSHLFKVIYDSLYSSLDTKSVPQAILILAGYQYKSAFVADQEINMVACLTEIMASCKFK